MTAECIDIFKVIKERIDVVLMDGATAGDEGCTLFLVLGGKSLTKKWR